MFSPDSDSDSDARTKAPTQVTKIAKLAQAMFIFGQTPAGDTFAVDKAIPGLVVPDRQVRARVGAAFFEMTDTAPSSTAVKDGLTIAIADAEAGRADPVEPSLRVARQGEQVVLDLGRQDGLAVVIGPEGWTVGPIPFGFLFRRTQTTAALPIPTPDGRLDTLRHLLNVDDRGWAAIVSWMVSALIPGSPHPVLAAGGAQGCGKTEASKGIVSIFDPSPAPVRKQPSREDDWVVAAAASHAFVVDNVSHIPDWFSDALCRVSTGEGNVRRSLYTNRDVTVDYFERAVILTSIDLGGLRGDLGDRMLPVHFRPLPDEARLAEDGLRFAFETDRPAHLGGLCSLVSKVLANLPAVRAEKRARPRLAGFSDILVALDLAVPGLGAHDAYLHGRGSIAQDVLEANPVAQALLDVLGKPENVTGWEGTAEQLRKRLNGVVLDQGGRPKGWPESAKALSGALRRLTPTFREVYGTEIEFKRTNGQSRIRITPGTKEQP